MKLISRVVRSNGRFTTVFVRCWSNTPLALEFTRNVKRIVVISLSTSWSSQRRTGKIPQFRVCGWSTSVIKAIYNRGKLFTNKNCNLTSSSMYNYRRQTLPIGKAKLKFSSQSCNRLEYFIDELYTKSSNWYLFTKTMLGCSFASTNAKNKKIDWQWATVIMAQNSRKSTAISVRSNTWSNEQKCIKFVFWNIERVIMTPKWLSIRSVQHSGNKERLRDEIHIEISLTQTHLFCARLQSEFHHKTDEINGWMI